MTSLHSRLAARQQHDFEPVSWDQHFPEALDIEIQTTPVASSPNSFRVYLKNFTPPLGPERQPGQRLDPQHAELTQDEINKQAQVPTLVMLHGGGYSALTWSQFVRSIEQLCCCRFLAIDLRGHGDTRTSNDNQMDIETLVTDVIQVTHETHNYCGFAQTPKIVLIGHSMGGAIAVKTAAKCSEFLPSLAGFVVIDVVEGTAKDALPLMMSVIKTRPTKFPTLANAIEWSVRSGMAKNVHAAKVSMPGNLINLSSSHLAIHDIDSTDNHKNYQIKRHKFSVTIDQLIGQSLPQALSRPAGLPLPPRVNSLKGCLPQKLPPPCDLSGMDGGIQEEDESAEHLPSLEPGDKPKTSGDDECYKRPLDVDKSGYTWRTNLVKTQPFWNDWFDGLSTQMLAAPVQGKFLLLAGIDRLDKTLTIGQMQGKFMMKVLPKCGHAVHEDAPEQVASAIGDFLIRNKFAQPCP